MSYTITVDTSASGTVVIDYLGEFQVGVETVIPDEVADIFALRHEMSVQEAFATHPYIRIGKTKNKQVAEVTSTGKEGVSNG